MQRRIYINTKVTDPLIQARFDIIELSGREARIIRENLRLPFCPTVIIQGNMTENDIYDIKERLYNGVN